MSTNRLSAKDRFEIFEQVHLHPANAAAIGYDRKYFNEAAESIGPYQRAGKVATFTERTQILPGVTAIPTPGYTHGWILEPTDTKILMLTPIEGSQKCDCRQVRWQQTSTFHHIDYGARRI
ncbi:MAG: organophosphate pesticide hydrolase [Gammaproteobacteria bacterium]|nr:organophosphate pesticide hydrolase [Gammaproteobacteria bacterium]